MIDATFLRPRRGPHDRARVAHAFTDEDYWFPFRSALCGKEVDGGQLTEDDVEKFPVCQSCAKRMARAEASAA